MRVSQPQTKMVRPCMSVCLCLLLWAQSSAASSQQAWRVQPAELMALETALRPLQDTNPSGGVRPKEGHGSSFPEGVLETRTRK